MQFRGDRSAHEIKSKGRWDKSPRYMLHHQGGDGLSEPQRERPASEGERSGPGKPDSAENPRAHPNKPSVVETDSGNVEAAGYYEGIVEAGNYDEGGDEVGKVVD
jgi:hypothetical protein